LMIKSMAMISHFQWGISSGDACFYVRAIEFLVSTVDGTVSLKALILAEVRLSSTRFHVLAIIASIDLTSGPSEVSSGVGFGLLAKGVGFLYAKAEENPLGYDAYECGYT
ncbi:hypothetical protein Tco_1224683, partial [Tanacetum coccineum]